MTNGKFRPLSLFSTRDGFTVRASADADLLAALRWTLPYFPELEKSHDDLIISDVLDQWKRCYHAAAYWLEQQPGRSTQTFIVHHHGEPLAFFKITHGHYRDQVQMSQLFSTTASRKLLLRGITTLVPIIEQALSRRGVTVILLTSHSPAMVEFLEKRLGFTTRPEYVTPDGQCMVKRIKKA